MLYHPFFWHIKETGYGPTDRRTESLKGGRTHPYKETHLKRKQITKKYYQIKRNKERRWTNEGTNISSGKSKKRWINEKRNNWINKQLYTNISKKKKALIIISTILWMNKCTKKNNEKLNKWTNALTKIYASINKRMNECDEKND